MMQSIALISGFQLIMLTNKRCYMFWQNSGNVQISDVSDTWILFEFVIDQKNEWKIFLTINQLINHYFSQPYSLPFCFWKTYSKHVDKCETDFQVPGLRMLVWIRRVKNDASSAWSSMPL